MPSPSRRVRRLHLRVAAHDDARHAATLLADALRTASFREADEGRLVVIRRLSLGRISVNVSAASLALRIERAAAEVMSNAVAWSATAAAEADAVLFADRGDAIVALASLHARGAAAREWFWDEIVPGWLADGSRASRWRRLLDTAENLPEAAVVSALIVAQAIAARADDELMIALSDVQAQRALRKMGWNDSTPAIAATTWRWPDGSGGDALRRWAAACGPADARVLWLAALIAVYRQPSSAADRGLVRAIARGLQSAATKRSLQAQTSEGRGDRNGAGDDRAAPLRPRLPAGASRLAGSSDISEQRQPADRVAKGTTGASSEDVSPIGTRTGRSRSEPAGFDPERHESFAVPHASFAARRSGYAGLLLVVPVLERLGFSAFLASQPDLLRAAFPQRLLLTIGERVGMTSDDPLAAALIDAIGDTNEEAAGSAIAGWLIAVRRWCRRNPRIGLVSLVRRPAAVHVSRTHIDAHFKLSQVDVRVRRWALDVDPGWVPWLGRVVSFTYGDDDEHHHA